MQLDIRKVIGLLGVASLCAGLLILYKGKHWEEPMLWICLGVLLLIEYKDRETYSLP